MREVAAGAFGAVGDGMADDTAAISSAIAAAADGGGGRVVLRPGDYRLTPAAGDIPVLPVERAAGVTIEGNGARLLVGDPRAGGLWLRGGRDVVVRDLIVDFDPVPFTQGVVVDVDRDAGTFVVDLDDRYLPPDHPAFLYDCEELHPSQFGSFFEADTRRLKAAHRDHVFVRAITPLGGSRVVVEAFDEYAGLEAKGFDMGGRSAIAEALRGVEAGDLFVFAARWAGTAVALLDSVDVRLERVEVRAAASHAFLAQQCGDVTLVDCGVRFAGGDRLITTDGDGFHYKDGRGRAVVEGGTFEGMLDDGFNINATPFVVRGMRSATEVDVRGSGPLAAGDRLLFQRPRTGLVVGVAEVETVDGHTVRLASAVDGLEAGENHASADIATNLSASGTGYSITGVTYRDHRGIAMRPRAGNGRIEGNVVQRTGSHAVLVCNDMSWPEGPIPHDVVIRDNTFEGAGRTNLTAAVRVIGERMGGRPAVEPIVERVTIEGNRIVGACGDGIYVGGCRDVTIAGNTVDAAGRDVVVEDCADVRR